MVICTDGACVWCNTCEQVLRYVRAVLEEAQRSSLAQSRSVCAVNERCACCTELSPTASLQHIAYTWALK